MFLRIPFSQTSWHTIKYFLCYSEKEVAVTCNYAVLDFYDTQNNLNI